MKTKLKKLISLITILCMVLSLAACGNSASEKKEIASETDATTKTEDKTVDKTEDKAEIKEELNSITESDLDSETKKEYVTDSFLPTEPEEPRADVDDGYVDDSVSADMDEVLDSGASVGTGDKSDISTDLMIDAVPEASEESYVGIGDDIVPPGVETPEEPTLPEIEPEELVIPEIEAVSGTLTAGEWNDNENYDFLLNLISDQGTYSSYVNAWKYSLVRKLDVVVMDNDGPADNVCVTLVDKEGKVVATSFTDIKGLAYLYVNPSKGAPAKCSVTLNGETKEIELDATSYTKLNEFKFDSKAKDVTKLDLCFVIDTTGSMSDELLYLQAELEDVIKTIDDYSAVDIRLSVNFYRDKGDEYVTKMYDFSGDISDMIDKLNEQMCNGGGDYEEAEHTVLDEAVNTLSWREDATKLMFLVLDAPAHREDPEVIPSITASLTTATEKGIRIMPIASSGVDKDTEFMLRGFSTITNGTYIFLTNHSGVGESHIEPSIGKYEVEKLNKLLVRVISERITLGVS